MPVRGWQARVTNPNPVRTRLRPSTRERRTAQHNTEGTPATTNSRARGDSHGAHQSQDHTSPQIAVAKVPSCTNDSCTGGAHPPIRPSTLGCRRANVYDAHVTTSAGSGSDIETHRRPSRGTGRG